LIGDLRRSSSQPTPLKIGATTGLLNANLPFTVRNLHTLLRLESDQIVDELELPVGGVSVLFVIADNPGISQNDIAAATALHKTAIANIVKPMVADGLISRHRSPADTRVNVLSLTPKGLHTSQRAELMLAALHERAFAQIPRTDRDIFFTVCAQLIVSLSPDAPRSVKFSCD
jgi:DNA-binding MarR family transcriptional regulator